MSKIDEFEKQPAYKREWVSNWINPLRLIRMIRGCR